MRVKWETWGGQKFEGTVTEVEDDTVHVRLDDGTMKAVNPNGAIIIDN